MIDINIYCTIFAYFLSLQSNGSTLFASVGNYIGFRNSELLYLHHENLCWLHREGVQGK
jgi:hypothetical protein